METSTLLLGAGQLVLAVAIGYIAWMVRRDSRRASLVALVTVLNELRERNNKALAAVVTQMSSDDFQQRSEQSRAGIIESGTRLRAVQATIAEAMLHTLHQCDTEWGFAGRLHEAFRSQIDADGNKDEEKLLAQQGLS